MWIARGASIGLACGVVELLIVAWPAWKPQAQWPGMFHVSPHWLWLKPLAGAALGVLVGGAGGLLAQLVPRLARPRGILWSITAASLLAAVFPFRPQIGTTSLLFLAAGGAVPVSAWLSRRAGTLHGRAVRVAVATTVGLLILAGAALRWVPALRESQHASRLPAPPAGAPNIVLVVLDTVRWDTAAALPNYRRLAASGVRFDQAYATSSWTLEAHVSMFTGRYPHHVFAPGATPINFETPVPRGMPTIAEVFRDRGYRTGGFVANTNYASREHGLDRGFIHYDDYPLTAEDPIASSTLGKHALETLSRWQNRPRTIGQRTAGQVTQAFLEWYDRQPGRPVFAFLNYFDAHDPYFHPDGPRGPAREEPLINPYKLYAPDEVASHRRAYEDCVRYVDDVIGALAAALEERGALESTVLVITSDHGEHFGERQLMTHGNSLYRELVQVPLVIRYPKAIPPGAEVSAAVSHRDLPATLLDLAGLDRSALPGTALSPLWRDRSGTVERSPAVSTLIVGREPHHFAPSFWPVSRGAMRSVVSDGLHYIRNGDGVEELYDFASDPGETRDISKTPRGVNAVKHLRALVDRLESPGS